MTGVQVQVIAMALLLGVGFVLRRIGQMRDSWMDGLNNLVLNVALPAMVIMAFQFKADAGQLRSLGETFGLSLAAHAVMLAAGYLLTRFAPADKRKELWFGTVFSNVGFIGFPVVQAAFPEQPQLALLYATMYVVAFHLTSWTIGRRMFDRNMAGIKGTLRNLANPTLIAVAVGAVLFAICNTTGWTLPAPLTVPLQGLADLTTPLSMLLIGARLGSMPLRGLVTGWEAPYGVLLRHMVCPGIVLALVAAFGLRGMGVQVVLLECSMPVAAFLAMFAERWDGNRQFASQLVAFSSLATLVSVSLWMWFIGYFA